MAGGEELFEGRLEGVVGYVFVFDLDPFEEGLVEEAFGGVGLEVGGLDVVGELEGEVDGLENGLVLDLVAAEELLGCLPFAA